MCTFRDYRETSKTNETLIYLYIPVDSFMEDVFVDGKPIIITVHAIRRARQRNIAFPDQVYAVLQTGKRKSIGKNGINIKKLEETFKKRIEIVEFREKPENF